MAILLTTAKQILAQHAEAILEVLPNIDTIDDPAWVDDGTEPDQLPKYTGSQWLDECTKRYWKRIIQVGNKRLYIEKHIKEDVNLE